MEKRYSSEHRNEGPPFKKIFDPDQAHKRKVDVPSVVILNTLKVSSVLQESINAEIVRDMVILSACAIEGQSL